MSDMPMLQRIGRVPLTMRFVDQSGKPVPPLGWHFPWEGNPNHCAMCERGPEELSRPDAKPCDFEWSEA